MAQAVKGSLVEYRPEELEETRRKVVERGLSPCHAFFACILASLAEINALNQAVANFMAKKAAPKIHKYLTAMGKLHVTGNTPVERLESLVKQLNEALEISPEAVVKTEPDGTILVGIGGGRRCRYCPKGVGEAQIPGTACPFPRLIEHLARLEGIDLELVIQRVNGHFEEVRREDKLCWIKYRIRGFREAS
ncbi:MAG: hypothetical protein GXO15_04085 [Crenarchaeota archaeon]|nr:hypothetical protein [Thermoproteota archaeon]